MPRGTDNQYSRRVNPGFRPKPLFDTRTNANPTGSPTMGSAGMSALERVQGTPIRPPFSRSPELNRIGGPPDQSDPFNFMRNLLAESGKDSYFSGLDPSVLGLFRRGLSKDGDPNKLGPSSTPQESGLRTLEYRKFIPGISREPQGGGLRTLEYRHGVSDPGSPSVQLAGGSPTPLFSLPAENPRDPIPAARPAPPQAMPLLAGSDQGLGEKLKAYRRKLESSPPREFTGPVQSYTPSPEARDQLAELDREIAQYNRVGQLAPGMAELRERQRAAMGSPAAARAYLDRQDPRFASMFRRFPGGQGAGQGAGQVSEAQADANYAKLLAGGEEMRGRDGLMVSQVGDRPKVDLSADEAAEQLLRRGDYYAHSPDGTGSSIFSKRRREQIRDQSLTKDRYFAPELAERMGLDPSTRFALKEQGEDGLVDTAYAKSAQRQEMLGERTGRLTQDAKAILKAAGVPTAGVRGKKKIEEAWMKYRENMAKGAPEARESGDPLMTKDGAPDTMAAESRLNAYGNARATTDKGRRARATAAQITGDPSVNIAEMEPTELVLNFMTNLPNATQEQFNMLHEMFRLHHMADSGKAESKRWDYGIITPSFLGSRLGDKAGEIRTILQEIQQIPETDKKALEDARKRWAEITKDYRATPASPPYTAPGLGVVLGS